MSVDLEDHFCDLPINEWGKYSSRVVNTTKKLLKIFDEHDVQATFFTLGYVAEKHPELIEEITKKGHEIASHGYSHYNLKNLSKESFEKDLLKSIKILEKTSGDKILGFRAPWFSISEQNLHVFEVLKKFLKYDSSIYPVGPHYGFASAPRFIYKLNTNKPLEENQNGTFYEIPMATMKLPLLGNFPIAGGIYLRFLPWKFIKTGIQNINKSNFSTMCYIHPQDLDPQRPKLPGTSWHNYYGLKNSTTKIISLLKEFKFRTARDVLKL
jgi:polysaccharide deacetylase family protein (PEP-CTERM system associated)|tara:strand:- start:2 stop:805 length:804 start_codon:yes stop_codon:yes gene_type:complete